MDLEYAKAQTIVYLLWVFLRPNFFEEETSKAINLKNMALISIPSKFIKGFQLNNEFKLALMDYVQDYLVNNNPELIKEHFSKLHLITETTDMKAHIESLNQAIAIAKKYTETPEKFDPKIKPNSFIGTFMWAYQPWAD